MDIRKYFNVEVTKNKETVFTKEKSTTDGSKPFIEYKETKWFIKYLLMVQHLIMVKKI